jgi:hypothetical protein
MMKSHNHLMQVGEYGHISFSKKYMVKKHLFSKTQVNKGFWTRTFNLGIRMSQRGQKERQG